MFIHCQLVIVILVLTLDGQVQTGKIFGGHKVEPHSRPYMVLLEQHMQDGSTEYCGGFLLNEDFVMTAAHCQARSYAALLGVDNFNNRNEIQRVSVKQIFPRKDYNATSHKNDIMLVKLSSKVKFNKKVGPIDLAGQDDGSLPKNCSVSGWGITDKNNKIMSPLLMEANVTLIDNKNCSEHNLYCSKGEIGPGDGDSGGPLVCEDGKAYGVVSFRITSQTGGPEIYAYAKISDNKDWIDSTIKMHERACKY